MWNVAIGPTRQPALFRFVQIEFPWALGPPAGRYVLRGHAGEPAHVLVIATLGAEQRRLLARRRGRRRAPPSPAPVAVATGRATLIGAQPFPTRHDAERWLAEADPEAEVESSLVVLNHVLHLHRAATADPTVRALSSAQALASRVGIGAGEQVADGRWARAREPAVAGPHPRRNTALRSQERLAALLGGRDAVLACETLALRAREDLDAGRQREAALQLRVALAAAVSELAGWAHRGDLAARTDELHALAPAVDAAAAMALNGGLDADAAAGIEHALGRLEAALRARSALGFG